MSYSEKQELKNTLMELPPALRIGRILLILKDRNMEPEAALEYVKEHSLDELCQIVPEARFKADLIKSIFEKHCLKGSKIDEEMFYTRRGSEVKDYFLKLSIDDMDSDMFLQLSAGLGDDWLWDDTSNSVVWDMLKEYHDSVIKHYITAFNSSDKETKRVLEDEYEIINWLADLLPIELMPSDALCRLLAPIDVFLSSFTTPLISLDEFWGSFSLKDELKDFIKGKRETRLEELSLSSEEDYKGYIEGLLNEYPLLSTGNQDFITTLKRVLSKHNADNAPAADLAYHLAVAYEE